MPNLPDPFVIRNWKQVAKDFDDLVFDYNRKGQYLPLIWTDNTRINVDYEIFGIPSYVGDNRQKAEHSHEAISTIGSVIGASFVGIDKSSQDGKNYVKMCEGYFNSSLGQFFDITSTDGGRSFWYDVMPNILAFQLADMYPHHESLSQKIDIVGKRYCDAVEVLKEYSSSKEYPDFDVTSFNFKNMKAVDNGKWIEPDAAAGYAWILYLTWQRTGEPKYLMAAKDSLNFLEQKKLNPLYELILPYGVYAAARMNAEHDTAYDINKYINWCFSPSDARYGWGVIAEQWGDYDAYGLMGSLVDRGGYGFAMNTFVLIEALIPVVRYDDRYAHDIGKWALNASNSLRLLYAVGLPEENQTCYKWAMENDPCSTLTYEGLRKEYKDKAPYAMGDPLVHGWAQTDFALYGAAYVGFLGGIIEPTNIDNIFRFNCNKGDFYQKKSYPTYLYYNPNKISQTVKIDVGYKYVDIYDAVSNRFLEKNVSKNIEFEILEDTAMVIVLVPSNSGIKYDKYKTYANNIPIDFNNGKQQRPTPKKIDAEDKVDKNDLARKVKTPYSNNIKVDGSPFEWQALNADIIKMQTIADGKLKCNISFAWDYQYLYILIREFKSDITKKEPVKIKDFVDEPWCFDSVSLYIDLDNSNNRETVGEFNPWFAFCSNQSSDMFCARSHIPGTLSEKMLVNSKCKTRGKIEDGNRIIEAAIAWEDIANSVSKMRQPDGDLKKALKPGLVFGCDPLLIDDDYNNQSYYGGTNQPFGNDINSHDLVLLPEKRKEH